MDKEPHIDICLPVLNGENYIEDTIKSIFNQDYKKFKLLIMLNKSNDNTEKICKKFKKKYKSIKLFLQKKKVSIDENWLNCLKKSKSKYIVIIGHDDVWSNKKYLKNLSKYLTNDTIPFGVVQMVNDKKVHHMSNEKNFSFDFKKSYIRRILFSMHPSILGKNNYIYGIHNRKYLIQIFEKFKKQNKSILIDGDNYFNFEILKQKKFLRVKNCKINKRLSKQELPNKNILQKMIYQFTYFFKFFKYSNIFEMLIIFLLIPLGITLNIYFTIKNKFIIYNNNQSY